MRKSKLAWILGLSLIGMGVVLFGSLFIAHRFMTEVLFADRRRIEYQAAIIPNGTNAPVSADMDAVRLAFFRRTMLTAYDEVGLRDPAWDEKARDFLESFVLTWSPRPVGELAETAQEEGQALVDLGCEDPLVLYCLGVVVQESGDLPRAGQLIEEALRGYEKAPYPRVRPRFAAMRLARIMQADSSGFRADDAVKWRKQACELLLESLGDHSYIEGEERLIIEHLNSDWNDLKPFVPMLVTGLRQREQIHPWARRVILGKCATAAAWNARGDTWASQVKKEQWKAFYRSLAEARTELEAAWELRPDYPEAAAEMIMVSMGQGRRGGDAERLWFDRAVSAEMDCASAYNQYIWALHPRWGGSHADMLTFGRECLETRRFDTDVPWRYFTVLTKILNDLEGARLQFDTRRTSGELKKMFDGYLAVATQERLPYLKSQYAATMWFIGEHIQARRLLAELGDNANPEPFKQFFDAELEDVQEEVLALGGRYGPTLRQAETKAMANDFDKAESLYKGILGEPDADAYTRRFALGRIELLGVRRQITGGEWTPLSWSDGLAGWSVRSGDWDVLANGALRGVSTDAGLILLHEVPIGASFELEGSYAMVSGPYMYKFNVGILLGYTDKKPKEYASVLVYDAENEIRLCRYFKVDEPRTRTVPLTSTGREGRFSLCVAEGRVSFSLGEEMLLNNVPLPVSSGTEPLRLALGGYYWYPGAEVHFSNLRMRGTNR